MEIQRLGRLIGWLLVAMIAATIVTVGLLVFAGHHTAPTHHAASSAFVQRGGHGHH